MAQQNLCSVLSFCNSPQMNAPEAYIQFTPGLFNDEGEVTEPTTAEFFQNFMEEFSVFIERVPHRPAPEPVTRRQPDARETD